MTQNIITLCPQNVCWKSCTLWRKYVMGEISHTKVTSNRIRFMLQAINCHRNKFPAKRLQFFLTLVNPAYLFFRWPGGGGGGGIPPHPHWKPTLECLIQILFYTVNNTYINSSDLKGFFPSIKTLDLAADQSSSFFFKWPWWTYITSQIVSKHV